MTLHVAHPIQTLREHVTNFQAALAVCLGSPNVRAVHRLRTESRRLEAQIMLLEALRGLPPYRKQADKVLRMLAKFRRAAGNVRDLDVQSKTLQDHSKRKAKQTKAHVAGNSDASEAKAPQQGNDTVVPNPSDDLKDLQQMIDARAERREKAAAELVALIEKRQAKIAAALEKLVLALQPAANMRLGAAELVRIADKRFTKTSVLKREKLSTDNLHTIRKAAKQARYLAETSGSQAAVAAAKRYEDLQEAGGAWHDWLDLASGAAKELGRKHNTTMEFAELRDRRLVKYREMLEQFR